MTTFTMQDLTPTREEEEAMQDLTNKQQAETIQGATGAQYEVIDFKKFEAPEGGVIQTKPNIHQLADQLTLTFNQLIKAITELQGEDKQPVSGGEGLHECVDTVLAEADWLMEKLEDAMDNRYDMTDLIAQGVDDSVRESVDSFFSNEFSLEDHVDVYSMVETAVDDKLNDLVEEKLADVVEEKLNGLMQGKNITISFN